MQCLFLVQNSLELFELKMSVERNKKKNTLWNGQFLFGKILVLPMNFHAPDDHDNKFICGLFQINCIFIAMAVWPLGNDDGYEIFCILLFELMTDRFDAMRIWCFVNSLFAKKKIVYDFCHQFIFNLILA